MSSPFPTRVWVGTRSVKKIIYFEFVPLLKNWDMCHKMRSSGLLDTGRLWHPRACFRTAAGGRPLGHLEVTTRPSGPLLTLAS